MKIAREVKIGALILLALLTLYSGINYLKGLNSFTDNRRFYAYYNNIEGLRVGNPVVIHGFRVGTITKIEFQPQMSGALKVEFTVTDKNVTLYQDTEAQLTSTDLLGSKAIQLKMGKSSTILESGSEVKADVLPSVIDNAELIIGPLKERTEHLLTSVDSLFTSLNMLVDQKFTSDLKKSMTSMKRSFQNLEESSNTAKGMLERENEKIAAITQNVYNISAAFAKNTANYEKIMANMKSVSDTLAAANLAATVEETKNAMMALSKTMTAINESEGTVGMLIHNDTLHTSIVSATNQLDLLLENFREYPNRYTNFSLFGRRDGIKLSAKEERRLKKLLKDSE
jgi:phospholipid/cholesterol/gamma-HCH transport system substrate-binding protein